MAKKAWYKRPKSKGTPQAVTRWRVGGVTRVAYPSTFRGVTYRSRTEARWALFLQEAGYEAVYEPEGWAITHEDGTTVGYLPDFYLPKFKTWLECKGAWLASDAPDYEKLLAFSRTMQPGERLVVGWGIELASAWRVYGNPNPDNKDFYDTPYFFGDCSVCGPSLFSGAVAPQKATEHDAPMEVCLSCGAECKARFAEDMSANTKRALTWARRERFDRN